MSAWALYRLIAVTPRLLRGPGMTSIHKTVSDDTSITLTAIESRPEVNPIAINTLLGR